MARSSKDQVPYFLLALVSLALGFIVWVIIRHQETEIRTIPVSVNLINKPDFIELESFEPRQLFVSFSLAKADELLLGQTGQFSVNVDLNSLNTQAIATQSYETLSFTVTQDDVMSPENLNYVRFDSPNTVDVRARMMVAQANVSRNIEGEPARGFELDLENIIFEPAVVQVAVDEERYRMAQIAPLSIPTEAINVTGLRDDVNSIRSLLYSETLGIYPVPGIGRQSVTVKIEVPEIREDRTVPNVPVRYDALRRDILAQLEPPSTSVTINGPMSVLSKIQENDIIVTPISDRQLDQEEPGTSVEIALQVSMENDLTQEERDALRISVADPSVVVTFNQIQAPSEPVEPEPTPTPTPEPEIRIPESLAVPRPPRIIEEDDTTTPTVNIDDSLTTTTE